MPMSAIGAIPEASSHIARQIAFAVIDVLAETLVSAAFDVALHAIGLVPSARIGEALRLTESTTAGQRFL